MHPVQIAVIVFTVIGLGVLLAMFHRFTKKNRAALLEIRAEFQAKLIRGGRGGQLRFNDGGIEQRLEFCSGGYENETYFCCFIARLPQGALAGPTHSAIVTKPKGLFQRIRSLLRTSGHLDNTQGFRRKLRHFWLFRNLKPFARIFLHAPF